MRESGLRLMALGSLLFLLFQHPAQAKDVKTLFALGQQSLSKQQYQEAVDYFEAVIQQDNNFAAAYYALGMVYQEISADPLYPIWYFETALEIDPEFAPVYDVLCRSYHQLERFNEAEAICLKSLEFYPDQIGAQLALAWVYLRGKSDPLRAIYYFENIVDRLSVPIVYFGLGMAYALNRDPAKAVDMVTKLRMSGSEDFAIHLENMIRSQSNPSALVPSRFISPPGTSQTALPSREFVQPSVQQGDREYVPVPVPVIIKPQITGSPTVHIKGKVKPPTIRGLTGEVVPNIRGGQSERHPGGLSDE